SEGHVQSPDSLPASAVPTPDSSSVHSAPAPGPVAPAGQEAADPSAWNARQAWLFGGLSLAFVSVLLFWGLSRFGIWDPWELTTADAARKLAAGEAAHGQPFVLGTWLVSVGFRVFGVHEWSGRVPIALAGLVCVASALWLGRRFADARTGIY